MALLATNPFLQKVARGGLPFHYRCPRAASSRSLGEVFIDTPPGGVIEMLIGDCMPLQLLPALLYRLDPGRHHCVYRRDSIKIRKTKWIVFYH